MGGASSREAFKLAVVKLQTEEVPATEAFWDSLWKTQVTCQDIYELIRPADVRSIVETCPGNVEIILSQSIIQLFQVVETPYPVYFEQALTCVRVLTRVLPLFMELDKESIRKLFWEVTDHSKRMISPVKGEGGDGKDDGAAATRTSRPSLGSMDRSIHQERPAYESEPLAVILVNTLFHLLFLPDFTIDDPDLDFKEEDVRTDRFRSALLWTQGLGSLPSESGSSSSSRSTTKAASSSSTYERNRVEILDLMASAFCDALFCEAGGYDSSSSLWLEVATSADAPYADIVFFSLINSVLSYDPAQYSLSGIVGMDIGQDVMNRGLRVLLSLLDYGQPVPRTHGEGHDTNAPGFNMFRSLLADINGANDYRYMMDGFVRLFSNAIEHQSTVLPNSVPRVEGEDMILALFWKCIDENPGFEQHVLISEKLPELVVALCFKLLEGFSLRTRMGTVYISSFILLKLSISRNLGVALNKPFSQALPLDMALLTGTHADLLVFAMHRLLLAPGPALMSLHNCYVTILCNVSPYCKRLGRLSAAKLCHLFGHFSAPAFLLSSPTAFSFTAMLLEVFDNLIQYQYDGNAQLVYTLAQNKAVFESLVALLSNSVPWEQRLNVYVSVRNRAVGIAGAATATGYSLPAPAHVPAPALVPVPTPVPPASEEPGKEEPVPESKDDEDKEDDDDDEKNDEKEANGDDEKTSTFAPAPAPSGEAAHGEPETSAPAPVPAPAPWVPTEAWLDTVLREALSLHTVAQLLENLLPQIAALGSTGKTEALALHMIKDGTMVGLLQVPHAIVMRRYEPSAHFTSWVTTLVWGSIYAQANKSSPPLFEGVRVKLFPVLSQFYTP